MADRKQTFTPEFRAEAVRLAQTSGRSRREIAADLGVGLSTLRNWIDGRREREMDHPPADRQEDMAAELKKPANITVWAWTPGTDEAVKMFEKAYPNIKVKLQNVGQGPPHYRKVRTVLKSSFATSTAFAMRSLASVSTSAITRKVLPS